MYCRAHMAQLRQDYAKYAERNTEVIAIGPEDAESFAEWWQENSMPFIGIPDPKHFVSKMYGQKINLLKLGRMPASLLIDKEGYIRFFHYGSSMKDIPEGEGMLKLIDELNSGQP